MIANGYLLGEAAWAECDSFDDSKSWRCRGSTARTRLPTRRFAAKDHFAAGLSY
jgi:hypothetical protein